MVAKIAVIMASFNRPKYISASIQSVLDQTFKDWKLYIMDNSSPNLWPTMQQIYSQYIDERIVVDHTEITNKDRPWKPLTMVANKGLFTLSEKEPYVILGVDDNVMMPNKLEILSGFLDTHPEASMVSGALELMKPDGSVAAAWGGVDLACTAGRLHWQQSMYRRELLEKAGIPTNDDPQPPDYLLSLRVALLTERCYGIPIVLDRSSTLTYGLYQHWTASVEAMA